MRAYSWGVLPWMIVECICGDIDTAMRANPWGVLRSLVQWGSAPILGLCDSRLFALGKQRHKESRRLPRRSRPVIEALEDRFVLSPVLFYSDLESGPNTGGENNHGAFVTVYGDGFGNTQGGSTVSATVTAPDGATASDTFVLTVNSAGTKDHIVPYHPRLTLRGESDWDRNQVGTIAWRIMHGLPGTLPSPGDPASDSEIWEYRYSHTGVDYGADFMFNSGDYYTYTSQVLQPIIAGKAMENGWNLDVPASGLPFSSEVYSPAHTRDEYYGDARTKLLWLLQPERLASETPFHIVSVVSMGYDWLYNATNANGTAVLSDADKSFIQQRLIAIADYIKAYAQPSTDSLFQAFDISHYIYVMVGFALYEPSRVGDASYAAVNAKAAEYLADFDTYWLGKIIPALNAQGGGAWHGGLGELNSEFDYFHGGNDVLPWHLAMLFLNFNTATGKDTGEFVYGALRDGVEFQAHMIQPDASNYFTVGGSSPAGDSRTSWVWPMFTYSRRRFSADATEQRIGELGAWIRADRSPSAFVDNGSWDMLSQTVWEDKWPNPRLPEQIGFPLVRRFTGLDWVSMRSGFASPSDLAALFVAQKYHWSPVNAYAQNAFRLTRNGDLIEGLEANTMRIGGAGQRSIASYPTVSDGAAAYAPGSPWDVGPGLTAFEDKPAYAYALGDATAAYNPAQLSKFTRQLVYLKPDIFVMFDRVVTATPAIEKRWVVDPAGAPVAVGGNDLLRISNASGGDLWMKRLLPIGAAVTVAATGIEVVPASPGVEDYFLHVFQAVDTGTAQNQVQADDATVTRNDGWFDVRVAGHVVSFDTNGGFRFDGMSGVPTISDIANQTTNTNTPTPAIAFTVGDAETAAGSLAVTGSSSNTTLVPNANIVFGGSGASRTVTLTPAANQTGTATIMVTVTDGGGATASDTFVLTVNIVNSVNLYFSLLNGGSVGNTSTGILSGVANEDIVHFNGTSFSLFFDGSDVSLGSFVLDAFAILSDSEILMSFTTHMSSFPKGTGGGTIGFVDDSDIVKFTASSLGADTTGTFAMYFDGSDVGLTTRKEDVDGFELLGGDLLISTLGSFTVTRASGAGEDIIRFTPTQLGDVTSGSWVTYFDGSDVGLSGTAENVGGLARDSSGRLYLSSTGSFAVPGVSGANEDIFVFTPSQLGSDTTGTYNASLFFDGGVYGLTSNALNAIELAASSAGLRAAGSAAAVSGASSGGWLGSSLRAPSPSVGRILRDWGLADSTPATPPLDVRTPRRAGPVVVPVFVHDQDGTLSPEQHARLADAITTLNAALGPTGVTLRLWPGMARRDLTAHDLALLGRAPDRGPHPQPVSWVEPDVDPEFLLDVAMAWQKARRRPLRL